MACGYYIKPVEEYFLNHNNNYLISNINDALEMYCIDKYIKLNQEIKFWTDKQYAGYIENMKKIKPVYCRYFSSINNELVNVIQELSYNYSNTFWEVFDIFKIYNNVSPDIFKEAIKSDKANIIEILKHKKIVEYYAEQIKDYLLNDPNSATLLFKKYLEKDITYKLYIPPDLSGQEKEKIVINYINSNNPHPNMLYVFSQTQCTVELPLSDTTRLLAKKRCRQEMDKIFKNETPKMLEATIKFSDTQQESIKILKKGLNIVYSYTENFISNHFDNHSILFNFIDLFEYLDSNGRITTVSKISEITTFEKVLSYHSKNDYVYGQVFQLKQFVSTLQFHAYYNYLWNKGVQIEHVLSWLLNENLCEEFDITDFKCTMPDSSISYCEKCKSLLITMESVIKQYSYYVKDGYINFELLQISSHPMKYEDIPSKINNKYVYCVSNDYKRATYYFFSDQCMLSYINRISKQYNTFYDLITNEEIYLSDYKNTSDIRWLIDNDFLTEKDGQIFLKDINSIKILKDLYENEFINLCYSLQSDKKLIKILCEKGYLEYSKNILLSKPEADYFNYYLNKTSFF